MNHSPMLLSLLLLSPLFVSTTEGQCNEQIINEPYHEGLLIRYNQQPCFDPLWFPFCENSGWGDEEAFVACRELGYAYGDSGLSVAYQGARGYASIDCDGTENRVGECIIGDVDFTNYCLQVGVAVCYNKPQVFIPEPSDSKSVSEMPVELCVAIRGLVEETAQVLVETSNTGSALANFDYVPVRSTLTFGPSQPSEQCLEIEIIDDSLAEGPEQITLLLSSPSSAVNITDDEFLIIIEQNDFELETCTEGSVTLVSDADGNSLQLVEMCSSEGVWSPVCDHDWTQQDASVVCRELGEDVGTLAVEALVEGTFYRGSTFPECSGNETIFGDCFTTTTTEEEVRCQYVLVNCNAEGNANIRHISLWLILSVVIVITMSVLIVVIVIGLVSVIYSRWKSTQREKHTPDISTSEPPALDNSNCATVTIAIPHSYPPLQSADDSDNTLTERELDTPSVEETRDSTDQSRHASFLSETAEHHLINPLYGEADEPPTPQATQDEDVEEDILEPHYDIPYASPPTDSVGSLNDAMRHHKYEYIDNSVAIKALII